MAARLLGQFDDDSLEIKEIAETIRGDPGLSAALLERANSPLFGFSHRIETVARAINMLGLSTVHRLTLTAVAHFFMKHGLKLVEFQRCWRHTLATAFLAGELAWACSMREEEAYMAGLLHDIGRIALISGYAAEYCVVLRRAEEETYDILELEREHFGVDHCELGRRLTESWNLPDPIRVAAGRHHAARTRRKSTSCRLCRMPAAWPTRWDLRPSNRSEGRLWRRFGRSCQGRPESVFT